MRATPVRPLMLLGALLLGLLITHGVEVACRDGDRPQSAMAAVFHQVHGHPDHTPLSTHAGVPRPDGQEAPSPVSAAHTCMAVLVAMLVAGLLITRPLPVAWRARPASRVLVSVHPRVLLPPRGPSLAELAILRC
ncbi:MAG: hypothetical protein ACRDPK_14925 [Carbonactinosporaceae bacterium]